LSPTTSTGVPTTVLPRQMMIDGDLILRKTKLTTLPEALSVTGDLDVTDTAICSLPPDIKVGGKLIGLGEKSEPS
jgi:hypothetical protein